MEHFTAYELEMKKNPFPRYNTPPAEVVEQIGLEACQPVKTASAALTEEDGDGTQEEAIEQVKQKRASTKHRLQDYGMGDDKVALRAANKTAIRQHMERQQQSSVHDGLLNSIGQFLQQDVHNSHVQSIKTFQEVKLLKLEELKRLGDLYKMKGTSEAFKSSIQKQMEKVASEKSNDEPPPPPPQRNQIPLAQEL